MTALNATSPDIAALLQNGWAINDDQSAIEKEFKFPSFVTAFGWMTQCAIWAEKLNHHPEWFNVYNLLRVVLTTHDTGGLSDLDVKLAQKMDQLASGF